MNEKLKDYIERYRPILDDLSEIIIILDERGFIVFWNKAGLRNFNWAEDTQPVVHYTEIVSEDYIDSVKKAFQDRISGKDVGKYRIGAKSFDGKIKIYEITGNPIIFDGKPVGEMALAKDVTSEDEARKNLEESEETFRSLAEESPNMIFINSGGRIVFVNRKCVEVMGYSYGEFLSEGFDFKNLIAEKDLPVTEEAFGKHMRGLDVKPYEYSLVTKSGHYINSLITTKLVSYYGEKAILGIVTDISYQKEIENILRQQKRQYQMTIDSLHDILHVVGKDLSIVLFNKPCKDTAVSLGVTEDLIGKNPLTIFPFLPKKVHKEYKEVFRTGKELLTEEVTQVGGKEFVTETTKLPVIEDGVVTQVITIVRDVTAKSRAEKALVDNERFLTDIFTSIQDGISIIDKKLNIIRVNKAMERWYSHNLPLIGKKCYEAYHCRGRPCKICPSATTLKTGKASVEIVPKTGAGGKVEGQIQLYTYPLVDSRTGKMEGVIEYVKDVTDQWKTAEALKESETKFRNLFENSNDAVFIGDGRDGIIKDCNMAASRLLGLPKKRIIGSKYSDIHPPEVRDEQVRLFKKLNKKNEPFVGDTLLLHKSGRRIPVNLSANFMSFGNRKIVQAVFRDITERKKTMDDLNQLNAFLSDILRNAPIGILTTDAKGNITSINTAIKTIIGSQSTEKTLSLNVLKLAPMKKFGIDKTFRKALNEGVESDVERFHYKSTWGKESITDTKIVPLFDVDGSVRGSIAIAADVTLQAQLETEVTDIKEHLETVINGIEEAIVVIDPKYNIVSHNKSFLTSLRTRRKDLQGAKCYEVIHGYKKPCRNCVVREMFKTGKPVGDTHYHLDGGKKVYHEVKAYPLKDSEGKLHQSVYVFRDVTERELLYEKILQAKEAAESLAKMKTDFASLASHEIKTPLAIIKAYAQLMSDGTLGPLNTGQTGKLKNMICNVDRLSDLVDKLLDISKLESGEVRLKRVKVPLKAIIDSVLSDLGHAFRDKTLDVKVEYGSRNTAIHADKTLIRQVIYNVLDNAYKFTEKGGNIRITVERHGKNLLVSISDTGVGIQKSKLDKIGQRFYQADSSISRKYKGAGLGIAICKRILVLHGGSLDIQSKYLKGTKVTISLPTRK
ncbi:PAS domain S-box protein [Candidatus Altiarchaeota archaeon]